MAGNVAQLQVLFPQFEREVLESVLHVKKDDIDDSIDALLAMDSGRHHNPNDPDLHVGVRPRPSKRTVARQRLRQRQRNLRKRDAQAKKVKWVRFNPFVTAIAKVPLKDENTFSPLLEEEEEDNELAEKEPNEEGEPLIFALEKEKDQDFPPLPSFFFVPLNSVTPEKEETPVVPDEKPQDEKEKQNDNVASDFTLVNITSSLSSSFIEANGGDDFVSVKLYFSDTDIRRLGIRKSDPSAFEKLKSSIFDDSSTVFAPKYIDEEKERVTVRSQEEFEECLRVHADFIWPAENQQQRTSAPILRLYL